MILRLFLAACMIIPNLGWGAESSIFKSPNVAGGFYPADPQELADQVAGLLSSLPDSPANHSVQIAISPHAGYVYSGSVAAHTFKSLAKNKYSTIVVVAPSHYYPFNGASLWPKGGFQTPLGTLNVDSVFADALLKETSVVKELPEVFNQEHALEVELPFIQKTFGDVKIVPLLMGQPDFRTCEELALALHKIIGAREDVLVLLSSDMSHYHAYDFANTMDARTLEVIKDGDIEGFWKGMMSKDLEMCGFVPVAVGMILARLRGDSIAEVLKYANSGDTAGDKARVVGYGSIIFHKPEALSRAEQEQLVSLARRTIEGFVRTGQVVDVGGFSDRLTQIQGAFVTITKNGQLRGCIGSIIGQEPLAKTVRDMSIAAATKDPRFTPVSVDELESIDVEVSVLSVPRRIKDSSEIVLGRDGVIVSDGGEHQGVFLPQVAKETGWTKEEFLNELCIQKAGLAADAWRDPKTLLYTFTAEVFGEK